MEVDGIPSSPHRQSLLWGCEGCFDPFPYLSPILTVIQCNFQASRTFLHELHQGGRNNEPAVCVHTLRILGSAHCPCTNMLLALQSPPLCPLHPLKPGTLQIETEVIGPRLEGSGTGFLQAGERVHCRSALKPSAVPFCSSYAVSALPSGGSESGRSTPSLSVHSDSRPPSSTYQQAPRHFHVPGRFMRA